MSILQGDVKLIGSQVMDDVDEGGGAPSGVVIPDGISNGVFNDVSELDRAGGRVNFRKLFVHVQTDNDDGYFGTNVIIAKPYADPRVNVALFATEDAYDRRPDAAARVESYLSRGAAYQGYLFGDHLAGQGVLLLLQRTELPLPGVGDTLVLQKNIGLSTQVDEYVRIKNVSATSRTFTDSSGDFTRALLTLELTNSLTNDFPGFDALRYDAAINYNGKTKISETVVADSARYYATVALENAASLGDTTIKVPTIFTQLVPSTRLEVPIADSRMNQQSAALGAAGIPSSATYDLAWTTSQALFLGVAVQPGSFSISRSGVTLTDKGGTLYNGGTAVGTIDYANGIARLSTNVFGTGSGTHSATFTPAAVASIVTDSLGVVVTQAGQRLNWVYTLDPVPARGTLSVAYRALGKWYVLTDDGSGALRGTDSSYGAGTLNFTTGTVSVTLGALPDVDSRIISLWASNAANRAFTDAPGYTPTFNRNLRKVLLLGQSLKPGTVSVAWNDGVARTATDSGGLLTGDATGRVLYGAGELQFSPNSLPAKGTTVTVTVTTTNDLLGSVSSFTDSTSTWTFSLGGPVKAGSVELGVVASYPERQFPGVDVAEKRSMLVTDDGAGNLVVGSLTSMLTVGTINYTTGACSITKSVTGLQTDQRTYATRTPVPGDTSAYVKLTGYETRTVTITFLNGNGGSDLALPAWAWWGGAQTNAAQYRASGTDAASAQVYPFTLDELTFPIADLRAVSIQGGAAVGFYTNLSSFKIGTARYVVNTVGSSSTLIRDPLPTTGEGTDAGTFAGTGPHITSWPVGASSALTELNGTLSPLLSGTGSSQLVDTVTARTAVSPLLPSSFAVAGTWSDGTTFAATADSNGNIASGTANAGSTPGSWGVFGTINYETGVIDVRFGRRVSGPGAGTIDISSLGLSGIALIESRGAQADTLRYNAVGYSYLPLDKDILGLNTVRLPADGRVPIFREGTFIVVGNDAETSTATVSNGQTINCARVRLSRVRVVGSDGLTINTGYTADLDAGTVTFTDVTGYAQPVKVEHRVEDMAVLSDVQINGQLSFTKPLTHDYPTTNTWVSSALIVGDIRARVSKLFDQQTWTNVWDDVVIGSVAPATFNDIQHPIVLTNKGTVTERWAIVFQSNNTSFNVVGENRGIVATGSINADCSPTNQTVGSPYFTIPAAAWGGGWTSGNVLRFNTVGAMPPLWALRSILQGPETVIDDEFALLARGDVDRP